MLVCLGSKVHIFVLVQGESGELAVPGANRRDQSDSIPGIRRRVSPKLDIISLKVNYILFTFKIAEICYSLSIIV